MRKIDFKRRWPVLLILVLMLGCCAVVYSSTIIAPSGLSAVKIMFMESDYKGAIKKGESLLSGAAKQEQWLDELYYYLGLSYMKTGAYMRAADIFAIIINEFPESAFHEQSYVSVVDSEVLSGDYETARKYAEEFLKKYRKSSYRGKVKERMVVIDSKLRGQNKALAPKTSAEQRPAPVYEKKAPAIAPSKKYETGDLQLLLSPEVLEQSASSSGVFAVQVGAFSSKQNADALANKLSLKGYKVFIITAHPSEKHTVYKVRVGGYATKAEAASAARVLSQRGYPTKILP